MARQGLASSPQRSPSSLSAEKHTDNKSNFIATPSSNLEHNDRNSQIRLVVHARYACTSNIYINALYWVIWGVSYGIDQDIILATARLNWLD